MATKTTTKPEHETVTITIDAAGKKLGRVASDAAAHLLGKNRTDFAKNTVAPVVVVITNASKLDIHPRKENELYTRYSGYPGGIKQETLAKRLERKGHADILEIAIRGMLPRNRLRANVMKHLTIQA